MDSYRIHITRRDFAAAYALNWRRILKKPWLPLSWIVLAIGTTLLMRGTLAGMLSSPQGLAVNIGIPVIVWALMYLLVPRLSAWIAARWQYDRYPMIARETDLVVEETGLKFLSAGDQWRHRWSDYLAIAEDPQVIVLYISPGIFQILPADPLPASVRATIAARIREANRKPAA